MGRYHNTRKTAKRMLVQFMAVVLVLTSAGCGKKDVNDGTSDGTVGGNLKEMLEIGSDEWNVSFASNDGAYTNNISAKISVPETGSMPVLELEKKVFTNDDKKKILETMCDAGSIYADSEQDLPVWYLDYKLADLENGLTYYEGMKDLEDRYDEGYQKCLEEQEKLQAMRKEGGVGIAPSDYSEMLFLGDIDGVHYQFMFTNFGFSCRAIDDADLAAEKPGEGLTLYCYETQEETGENQCAKSESEMENQTRSLLKSIGLDEYIVYDTHPLVWETHIDYTDASDDDAASAEEKKWNDGYSFTYTREVNGVAVDYTDYDSVGISCWMAYNGGEDIPCRAYFDASWLEYTTTFIPTYGMEYMNVRINEKGLVGLDLYYPYEVKQTLTEETKLLPISKIQDSIQAYLKQHPNVYCYDGDNMDYTQLDLIYMRIADEDGYALLPVWRLSGWDDGSIFRILCVNAIDGSVIDVISEMYNLSNSEKIDE